MAAGSSIASMFVKVGADVSGFARGMAQVQAGMAGASRGISSHASAIGMGMTKFVTAPVVAGFALAIKAAAADVLVGIAARLRRGEDLAEIGAWATRAIERRLSDEQRVVASRIVQFVISPASADLAEWSALGLDGGEGG